MSELSQLFIGMELLQDLHFLSGHAEYAEVFSC
jgi:hypothetical protein